MMLMQWLGDDLRSIDWPVNMDVFNPRTNGDKYVVTLIYAVCVETTLILALCAAARAKYGGRT